jgi:hypothetical protein
LEDTEYMDSGELVPHAVVGYFQNSGLSIPGTKVEQGHFAEANLASSMDVVVVERRVDSSWKVVGMVLDTYLSS